MSWRKFNSQWRFWEVKIAKLKYDCFKSLYRKPLNFHAISILLPLCHGGCWQDSLQNWPLPLNTFFMIHCQTIYRWWWLLNCLILGQTHQKASEGISCIQTCLWNGYKIRSPNQPLCDIIIFMLKLQDRHAHTYDRTWPQHSSRVMKFESQNSFYSTPP